MISELVVVVLVLSFIVTVALMAMCATRRDQKKLAIFQMLVYAVSIVVLGSILELLSPSFGGTIAAVKLKYIGLPFVAPLFLLFIADYCEYKVRKTTILVPILSVSMVASIIAFTGEHNTLFFEGFYTETFGRLNTIVVNPGIACKLMYAYGFICNLIGIAMLLIKYKEWNYYMRQQGQLFIIGSCIYFLAYIMNIMNIFPYGINFTPIAQVLLLIFLWVSMTNFGLFELMPRALDIAISSMQDAFIMLDHRNCFLTANEAAYILFPDLRELKQGVCVEELEIWPVELKSLTDTTMNVNYKKFSLERESGFRHYEIRVSEVTDLGRSTVRTFMIRDLTDTTEMMERLEMLAFTDGLTGVFNRRYFIECAEREVLKHRRENKPFAILMIDLDHFKNVNDTHGHIIGDEVLRVVSGAISRALRPSDLFARYGGEEFIALIPTVESEIAVKVAERIRGIIENTRFNFSHVDLSITISIGVAVASGSEATLAEAISVADRNLYEAKEKGRNCVEFVSAQQEE